MSEHFKAQYNNMKHFFLIYNIIIKSDDILSHFLTTVALCEPPLINNKSLLRISN